MNSSANGVALIAKPEADVDLSLRTTLHTGSHPGYDEAVEVLLDGIEKRLKDTGDVEEAKQLLSDAINLIRDTAQQGLIRLNNTNHKNDNVPYMDRHEIEEAWTAILQPLIPSG